MLQLYKEVNLICSLTSYMVNPLRVWGLTHSFICPSWWFSLDSFSQYSSIKKSSNISRQKWENQYLTDSWLWSYLLRKSVYYNLILSSSLFNSVGVVFYNINFKVNQTEKKLLLLILVTVWVLFPPVSNVQYCKPHPWNYFRFWAVTVAWVVNLDLGSCGWHTGLSVGLGFVKTLARKHTCMPGTT